MSRLAKGYLIALTGITFWSTTGVFIGYLITNYEMPALVLAFWRNLLVCAGLIWVLAVVNRPLLACARQHLRFYILYGLVLAIFNSIWTISVETNGAAVATVLGYSSAGFTAILARWLFQEKLGLPKIMAIILSLIGCVLVSNAYSPEMWRLNPLGIVTGLLSGLLFAAYNLFGKEAASRQLNAWTSLLYSFAFGSVFILLFNLLPFVPGTPPSLSELWPDLPVAGWLVLLLLALVPTLLGFGLYVASMNYLPVSIASLLATLEPALTAVEAYIFLGERMSPVQIGGSVIILLAVVFVQLEKD